MTWMVFQRYLIWFSLIFLKILDISGIEFIGVFSKMPNGNFIIAYSEYAVIGFELDGVDYLLRPFSSASVGSCYAFIINFVKFRAKFSSMPW